LTLYFLLHAHHCHINARYLLTYLLTYLVTYLLTYLLNYITVTLLVACVVYVTTVATLWFISEKNQTTMNTLLCHNVINVP